MAANVIESVDRLVTVVDNYDAFTREVAREVVACGGNAIGAPRADPAAKIEAVDLALKNLGIRVVAAR
ncbi:MAG TPA: hypothetical protein VH351_00635 [Bryobacteraceae bacterium]|jgi:hypothetical protein|nr:hypothetical protein [Bryobacteraceae bacterium]